MKMTVMINSIYEFFQIEDLLATNDYQIDTRLGRINILEKSAALQQALADALVILEVLMIIVILEVPMITFG